MKNKNLLLNLFVALGFVAAVVGLFLNFWTGFITIGDATETNAIGGLFVDLTGSTDTALATMAQVLLLVGLALVLLYVVLYALEYFKVLKKTEMLRMITSACAVLVAGIGLVLGFVFCSHNTEEVELIHTVAGVRLAIGCYLSAIGTIIAGVFGVLASRK